MREYASAGAFRRALEDRLHNRAKACRMSTVMKPYLEALIV